MKVKSLLILISISLSAIFAQAQEYASTDLIAQPEIIIPPPDEMSIGVILIQFSDWQTNLAARGSIQYFDENDTLFYHFQNYYDLLFSVRSFAHPDGHTVFGSMYNYYQEVSHARPGGSFSISGEILNNVDGNGVPIWYIASHTKSYYGDTLAERNSTLRDEAVTLAQANGFNPGNYDKLCILYAGELDADHHSLHPSANRVGGEWYYIAEKFQNAFAHIGVHCHEFAHLLGLSDHYKGATYSPPSYGSWGLMGNGYKNGDNYGSRPVHMTGLSKVELAFVPVVEIDDNMMNQSILPIVASSSNIMFHRAATYRIYHHGQWHETFESFYIENRQKSNSTFDALLPGEGLLIYRGNQILEADGTTHLLYSDYSDAGDPFPGTSSNTMLTDFTTPNSKICGGDSLSHFAVLNISEDGDNITADFIPNYWEGQLTENTTWTSDKPPYYMGGNITAAQYTLTINSGAIVDLNDNCVK